MNEGCLKLFIKYKNNVFRYAEGSENEHCSHEDFSRVDNFTGFTEITGLCVGSVGLNKRIGDDAPDMFRSL